MLAPRPKRVTALLVALFARIALQRISGRVFDVATAPPWLVLPRDLFGFAVWACGLTGKAVRWRGAELHIEAGDVLAEWRGKTEINSPSQQHSGD
jgi:hypothetical protein